jgi:hypothetical protein
VESLQAARKIRISYPAVVAVSAACLFLLRGVPRLRAGTLHLEDGQIYFSQAHNMGLAALLETDRRYIVPVYRIIAALLEPFPVTAAPVLYPLAALLAHLAMLTPALSARLEWIIPGRMLRAVLFALLCLMPGLWESLAIVTHLGVFEATCLLLLMLSDDPRSRAARVGELAAVVVMGLSGVLMVIFAPWFGWRWWRTRSRHSLAVLAVAVAEALVGGVVLLTSGSAPRGEGNLIVLPRMWIERVGGTWLFGDSDLLNSPSRMLWLVVALAWCIGAVVITVVALRRTAVVLWLLFLAWLAPPVLAYGYLPPPRSMGRHFVIPLAIIIVLLVAAIGVRRWTIAAVAWLALGAGAMMHDFQPEPYWPDPLRPICYFRPGVKFSPVGNFGSPKACLPSVSPDLRDPRDPSTWNQLFWRG